jgi:hypothetical protein
MTERRKHSAQGWDAEAVPFGETVRTLFRHLPHELAGGNHAARIRAAADALPATLSREFYVECRLHDERRVDVIAGVTLSGLAGPGRTLAEAARARGWPHIYDLCRRLTDPRERLLPLVDHLWLEFDAPAPHSDDSAIREPGVFLHLRAAARHRLDDLRRIHDAIAGGSTPPDDFQYVARSLPAAAAVHYVGRMYSRPGGDAVRLCVGGVTPPLWFAWLDAGRRAGSTDSLARVAALFASPPHGAAPTPGLLHIDVERGLGARVGIEYVFERRRQAGGGFAHAGLLQRLVDAGLCAPDKCRALLEWPGCGREWLDHQVTPSIWARRVNHVKVTADGTGDVEAKAYLYCAGYVRARNRLVRA